METESGAADLAAARGCAEVPHRLRTVSGRREAAVGAGAGRRGRCQSEHHAARARCAGGERARQRPAEHRALCHTG